MPLTQTIGNSKYVVATWSGLDKDNLEGDIARLGQFKEKTVQIIGDLDSATFALQGSMDGTNWATLTKDGTNGITGLGLFRIHENPEYIRPLLTLAGVEEPTITVIVGASGFVS